MFTTEYIATPVLADLTGELHYVVSGRIMMGVGTFECEHEINLTKYTIIIDNLPRILDRRQYQVTHTTASVENVALEMNMMYIDDNQLRSRENFHISTLIRLMIHYPCLPFNPS